MKLELQPRPNQTLADQLFAAGVEFPCGGESACGGCKVRVVEGDVPVTATMRDALAEDEIRDGWRLACCASAAGRVVVEVEQWSLRVLVDAASVPVEPRAGLGAVVDLGTTTLVAQVVDLASGEVVRVETALNPQARFGADVMSRLQYDLHHPGELGRLIRETLGRMLGGAPLGEVLVAGNTAMHHLFCMLGVEPLTHAPFLSPTLDGCRFPAADLGWPGPAEFLPCLGGFVGSDLLCGIVATRLDEQPEPHALFDIGTNGEVLVGSAHGILCASTAAGPAFEGGRIGAGMRAGAGAIDSVHVRDGGLTCHVIGGGAARGVCGSGLVDAAACGVELGWIRSNGRLVRPDQRLPLADGVALTQGDIRELQLAKGAMAAGLRMLGAGRVGKLYLAGAFGNYIRLPSARAIGLLPADLPVEPVGNTALRGARMLLLAPSTRQARLRKIAALTRHVELAADPDFQYLYAEMMALAGANSRGDREKTHPGPH
ncbi:MAG TPA: ASKHA domain-containing protein [Bryobacteraceae bacterium]|nr:ASKHA domain-containing protein [Bryobacteraceae bacterium]